MKKYLTTNQTYDKIKKIQGALAQLGAHNTGSVGVRGSSPLCSTSGKLPPPIIGGMRCYAKHHTTMAVFGFKAHASTRKKQSRNFDLLFSVKFAFGE